MSTSVALDSARPQLIALIFITVLQGILTVQVFLYYLSFPTDRAHLKILVYGVYALELSQVVILYDDWYKIFVEMFFASGSDVGGTGSPLDLVGKSWIGLVIGAAVTLAVQCLYAYRIYVFGNSLEVIRVPKGPLAIGVIIVLLSLLQCGAGTMLAVEAHKAGYFSRLISRNIQTAGGVWNGGGVMCDFIIAVSMTYLLYTSSQTGMRQTRRIVQRLIRLTIETGTCTVIIAIINVVTLDLPKEHPTFYQTLVSTVSTGILSKVYANSMLVLLNSRATFSCDDDEPAQFHEIEWNATEESLIPAQTQTQTDESRWRSISSGLATTV